MELMCLFLNIAIYNYLTRDILWDYYFFSNNCRYDMIKNWKYLNFVIKRPYNKIATTQLRNSNAIFS